MTTPTRREVLRQTVYASGGLWAFGRAVCSEAQAQARAPRGSRNGKMGIAGIGTGGQGEWDILGASKGNEVVAVCDEDSGMGYKTLQRFRKAKRYQDTSARCSRRRTSGSTPSPECLRNPRKPSGDCSPAGRLLHQAGITGTY